MLEGVFDPGGLGNLGPGVLPLLLQPLAFGAGYVRLEQIMDSSPSKDAVTARGVTAWQLAFTALGCLAYSIVAEGPTAIPEVVAAAEQSSDWSVRVRTDSSNRIIILDDYTLHSENHK